MFNVLELVAKIKFSPNIAYHFIDEQMEPHIEH